jgi:hypothetical protein
MMIHQADRKSSYRAGQWSALILIPPMLSVLATLLHWRGWDTVLCGLALPVVGIVQVLWIVPIAVGALLFRCFDFAKGIVSGDPPDKRKPADPQPIVDRRAMTTATS